MTVKEATLEQQTKYNQLMALIESSWLAPYVQHCDLSVYEETLAVHFLFVIPRDSDLGQVVSRIEGCTNQELVSIEITIPGQSAPLRYCSKTFDSELFERAKQGFLAKLRELMEANQVQILTLQMRQAQLSTVESQVLRPPKTEVRHSDGVQQ